MKMNGKEIFFESMQSLCMCPGELGNNIRVDGSSLQPKSIHICIILSSQSLKEVIA
jgi:hypothetical protein